MAGARMCVVMGGIMSGKTRLTGWISHVGPGSGGYNTGSSSWEPLKMAAISTTSAPLMCVRNSSPAAET
jgi:hypothetical protein